MPARKVGYHESMTRVSLRPARAFIRLLSALVSTAVLWPLPALAQSVGTPARWVADFGDTMCSLSRGVGPEPGTIFRLEWSAGGEVPGLLIGNPAWKKDLVESEQPAVLILTPGGTRIAAKAFPLSSPIRPARGLSLYQMDKGFLGGLSSATAMIVEVNGRKVIEFALPQTAAAVRTLQTCNDTLLKAMGVDPALVASLRQRPKPVGGSVARWVKDSDYPADALRRKSPAPRRFGSPSGPTAGSRVALSP